jgi:hypothetical protein
LIEGEGKDGWSEEELNKFKDAWENSKNENFTAKCKSISEMVGKSLRQCLIKAALMDLNKKPSQ